MNETTNPTDGHEVKVNGHRIKFYVRDVLYCVATILSVVGIYFLSSNRITNAEGHINDLYDKYDKESKAMVEMDRDGTRKDNEDKLKQQAEIDLVVTTAETARVRSLENEHILMDLHTTVDKIDTNVLWLMQKQLQHH